MICFKLYYEELTIWDAKFKKKNTKATNTAKIILRGSTILHRPKIQSATNPATIAMITFSKKIIRFLRPFLISSK